MRGSGPICGRAAHPARGSGPDHPVGGLSGASADLAGGGEAGAEFAGGAEPDLADDGPADVSGGGGAAADPSDDGRADVSGGGGTARASSRGAGFSTLVPHAASIPPTTKTAAHRDRRRPTVAR